MPKGNPEHRSQDLLQEMDAMLAEVSRLARDSDAFYQDLGLDRGAAARYLNSDKVPAHARARVQSELAAWEQEVAEEVDRAEARFKAETAPRRRPRLPRMPV
jgi:hypothetical protein